MLTKVFVNEVYVFVSMNFDQDAKPNDQRPQKQKKNRQNDKTK